jgi:hypothetical protein
LPTEIKYHVPFYIQKSANPKVLGHKVGGIISDTSMDSEGERVDIVDWSYIDKGLGKIKYEHDKDPGNVIGFPEKVFKKDGKTYFEGRLVPYDPDAPDEKLTQAQRTAKRVVELLKNIETYNAGKPTIVQKAGWSIEGAGIPDKKTGRTLGSLMNIAFTMNPVNPQTTAYLQIEKSLEKYIKEKSLEVGYEHSSTDQTGWNAVRRESLEGQKQNNSRRKKMNKNAVYEQAIRDGKSKDEALKVASEWLTTNEKLLDEDINKSESMLKNCAVAIEKSVKAINEAIEIEPKFDAEKAQKRLEKSFNAFKEAKAEEQDPAEFMYEQQKVTNGLVENFNILNDKLNVMLKSVNVLFESLSANSEVQVNLLKSFGNIADKQNEIRDAQFAMFGGMKKAAADTVDMNGFYPTFDPSKGSNGAKILNKSQAKHLLTEMVTEGKVSKEDVLRYELDNVLSPQAKKALDAKIQETNKNN